MEPLSPSPSVTGSYLYSNPSGPVELLPNPDFVFPALPESSKTDGRRPSSVARRPRSEQNLAAAAHASAHQTRASISALPLPQFSFNPAGSANDAGAASSTPPLSPALHSPSTPSRARHRRGGSELIGDDRGTGSVSIALGPTHVENPAAPATVRLGPPAGRRHAHRRSGAISCHDLASILQPKDFSIQARSGSAPTSPLNIDDKIFSFPTQSQHTSGDSISSLSIDTNEDVDTTPVRRPVSRARVGFADRVEYIRPLSTISSETESSMSTVRGHSVNESWSSIASVNNLSPARRCRPSLDTTFEDEHVRRPNTSQPLPRTPNLHGFTFTIPPTVNERPRSEAGPPSSSEIVSTQPKRKSFSWWDHKGKRPQLEQPKATASTDTELASSPPPSPKMRHSLDSDQETIKTAMANAERKKPRKVKSWAHSLISRKHKPRATVRPATPPTGFCEDSQYNTQELIDTCSDTEPSEHDFDFDHDNTVTIVDATNAVQPVQPLLSVQSAVATMPPPADSNGPVIDLDFAIDLPVTHGTRPVRSRQSMHSASMSSGAFNFAAQHRRTESAPQLNPFELRIPPSFALSNMPDVFEEEDEELLEQPPTVDRMDVHSSEPLHSADDLAVLKTGLHVAGLGANGVSSTSWPARTGFGSARLSRSSASASESGSRPSSLAIEPADPIGTALVPGNIESTQNDACADMCSPNSYDVRLDTPLSDYSLGPPPILRYSIALQSDQVLTPGTASDASVYSPFFSPSQASLVGAKIDTGASSINESASFLFGEPGPEVRVSVDDVPSLSSSRSTMTSPAMHGLPGSAGGLAPSIYSIRSATTTDFTRQKRGSIASLSRLVADRFERSKLSIESRPVTSSAESTIKVSKVKQRRRLSRIMQFWRSKETA